MAESLLDSQLELTGAHPVIRHPDCSATIADDKEKLLEEIADYSQTADEAKAELVEDEVDVNAFLARVYRAVEDTKKS
jgi:hypothetical protein